MSYLLAIALTLAAANLPEEPPAEARRLTAERPRLLWEEGPAVTWTLPTAPPRSIALALDAPVFPPDAPIGSHLVAHLDAGARVAFTSGTREIMIIEGPRSWRVSLTDADGTVTVTRAAGIDVPAANLDALVLELPPGWGGGPFAAARAASPAPAIEAPGFCILWPAGRSVRPEVGAAPPRIAWHDPAGEPDARYDLEVAVVDGSGASLEVLERWWKVAGPSFSLVAPWPEGARIALTVAPAGQEGTTVTNEVLSSDDGAALAMLRAGIAARRSVLGPHLTTALDAVALEQYGLDSEARAVWWHLGISMMGQSRGAEVAARSGAWPR